MTCLNIFLILMIILISEMCKHISDFDDRTQLMKCLNIFLILITEMCKYISDFDDHTQFVKCLNIFLIMMITVI
jgi:hypothetical protein